MTVLLLLACASGTVVLSPDSGALADDSGDTGDTGPQTSPFEGDYTAWLGLYVPEWGWDMCEGEADLEVDEEGNLDFEAECWGEEGDEVWSIDVWGDGVVEDDGTAYGTAVFEWWERDESVEIEADFDGTFDEDGEIELEWTAEDVNFGRGDEEDVEGWLVSD